MWSMVKRRRQATNEYHPRPRRRRRRYLQMLIRGSNAVGYTSYPDNVVTEFVRLAAENGIDVFRVFDCFNDIEQMRVCIKAVRDAGKVAEVREKSECATIGYPV